MKKIYSLSILLLFFLSVKSLAQGPVSRYGKLKLSGLQLSSECLKPVQLKGISSHGPQWFPGCYNNTTFLDAIANDWKADVFRLALYVEEGGYIENPAYWKSWIDHMVDEVGKRDIYCIIDWHVLADGDPNKNLAAAVDFWSYMSGKHGKKKHVIYEICNEPNERYKYGHDAQEIDVNWVKIKEYAEKIIPVIRKNDPESVIIVGTPYWSNRPWRAALDPLTGSNAYNVMYTYHFYAGTPQHTVNLDTVSNILNKIPVFATEWGLSEESGTGIVDNEAAQNFADVLGGKNPAGIQVSWCVWSFADKDETSALLKPYSCSTGNWNNRTPAGIKTLELINSPGRDSTLCFPEPRIIKNPSNQVIIQGGNATLNVMASGESLSYQWQKSTNGSTWHNISTATSSLVITSVALTDKAYYRVKVSNMLGYLYSQSAFLGLYADGPYTGLPFNIPGKIEAEDYDIGGQGKSYSDKSSGNTGNAYRKDDVDIQGISDSLGGYGIGYIDTDEWMEYSVNILATASYDFSFRVGSALSDKSFKVTLDGITIIPKVVVANVGNWNSFANVAIKGVYLTKGFKKLRIHALTDGFNINYFEAKGPQIDCNNELNGTAVSDACGYCSGGNTGVVPLNDSARCYIISNLKENNLTVSPDVYPNPFTNYLIISSPSYPCQLQLYNLNGALVLAETLSAEKKFDLSSLSEPGIYHLKVVTPGAVYRRKLVKN